MKIERYSRPILGKYVIIIKTHFTRVGTDNPFTTLTNKLLLMKVSTVNNVFTNEIGHTMIFTFLYESNNTLHINRITILN